MVLALLQTHVNVLLVTLEKAVHSQFVMEKIHPTLQFVLLTERVLHQIPVNVLLVILEMIVN
jgi:hypothetical protein